MFKGFFLILGLLLLNLGVCQAQSKKELKEANEDLKRQFNELAAEKAKLDREKRQIEVEKSWISDQLRTLHQDNAQKGMVLDKQQTQIKQIKTQVEESKAIIEETRDVLESQSDSLSKLAEAKEISDLMLSREKLELDKQRLITENQKASEKILIGGILFVLLLAFLLLFLYFSKKKANIKIEQEKKKSDELLLNILPEEVADELKKYGKTKAKSYSLVTVLFADIKNFTKLSEKMTPEQLIKELDIVFGAFDEIIQRHNIERIKIIGDCYMCAGGIPVANTTNPIDVVSAAREMCSFMNKINIDKKAAGHEFFNLRIGVHSGPIVAGIVGTKKFAYDIWGDTVNIAARLESSGEVGQINISETTYNLVKDKYPCTPRGKLEAKNKGLIDMYFVD
ncbi:MAG: hypothetical protein KA797_05880 [Chitinophagales bacterium]|nr:hypothetical protein [Chitinophagales bacterium]